MKFSIEETLEKRDYRAQVRAAVRLRDRTQPLRSVLHAVWAALVTCLLAYWVVSLAYVIVVKHTVNWPGLFTILVVSALLAYVPVKRSRWFLTAKACKNNANLIGQPLSCRFDGKKFTVRIPAENRSFDYPSVNRILETQAYYLLFLRSGALILRKAAFTEGDPEAFRDFISRVTGKPVVFVK